MRGGMCLRFTRHNFVGMAVKRCTGSVLDIDIIEIPFLISFVCVHMLHPSHVSSLITIWRLAVKWKLSSGAGLLALTVVWSAPTTFK